MRLFVLAFHERLHVCLKNVSHFIPLAELKYMNTMYSSDMVNISNGSKMLIYLKYTKTFLLKQSETKWSVTLHSVSRFTDISFLFMIDWFPFKFTLYYISSDLVALLNITSKNVPWLSGSLVWICHVNLLWILKASEHDKDRPSWKQSKG